MNIKKKKIILLYVYSCCIQRFSRVYSAKLSINFPTKKSPQHSGMQNSQIFEGLTEVQTFLKETPCPLPAKILPFFWQKCASKYFTSCPEQARESKILCKSRSSYLTNIQSIDKGQSWLHRLSIDMLHPCKMAQKETESSSHSTLK